MENDLLEIETHLNDGKPVKLCAWEVKEAKQLPEHLRQMAWPTEYWRFFVPVTPGLNAEQNLDSSRVKDPSQRVWVALEAGRPNQPIGIGRLHRFGREGTVAEISGAVETRKERRGLGRILLAQLYLLAQSEGIKSLRLVVPEKNRKVVQWFRRLGATAYEFRDEVVELDLPVYEDAGMLPDNSTTRQFKATIDQLEECCCIP